MGNSSSHDSNFLAVKAFITTCELEVLTHRNLDSTSVFQLDNEELKKRIKEDKKYMLKYRKQSSFSKEVLEQIHRKLNMVLED